MAALLLRAGLGFACCCELASLLVGHVLTNSYARYFKLQVFHLMAAGRKRPGLEVDLRRLTGDPEFASVRL